MFHLQCARSWSYMLHYTVPYEIPKRCMIILACEQEIHAHELFRVSQYKLHVSINMNDWCIQLQK